MTAMLHPTARRHHNDRHASGVALDDSVAVMASVDLPCHHNLALPHDRSSSNGKFFPTTFVPGLTGGMSSENCTTSGCDATPSTTCFTGPSVRSTISFQNRKSPERAASTAACASRSAMLTPPSSSASSIARMRSVHPNTDAASASVSHSPSLVVLSISVTSKPFR